MTLWTRLLRWIRQRPAYDFCAPHSGRCCGNCVFFLDYRDTESDWANGYCGHPDHVDPKKSQHFEYGGHWTNDAALCGWWSGQRTGQEDRWPHGTERP